MLITLPRFTAPKSKLATPRICTSSATHTIKVTLLITSTASGAWGPLGEVKAKKSLEPVAIRSMRSFLFAYTLQVAVIASNCLINEKPTGAALMNKASGLSMAVRRRHGSVRYSKNKLLSGGKYTDSFGRRTRSGFLHTGYNGQLFAVEKVLPPLNSTVLENGKNVVDTMAINSEPVSGPLPVVYTNDPVVVERWLCDHVTHSVVGFDVESVPDAPWMKNKTLFDGPATIQISTPDACLVAHMTRDNGKRRSTVCPAIEVLLSDETIVKTGTGIDYDMLELYQWNQKLDARSRFDLGGVGADASERMGLQRLVRGVLGIEMRKSKRQATSNWSKVPLTDNQLAYCARDAWAGAAVLHNLAQRCPETFGTDALRQLMLNERPMRDLNRRIIERKQARIRLAEILEPHKRAGDGTSPVKNRMPASLKNEVTKLQAIIEKTAPDACFMFDAERLGLLL